MAFTEYETITAGTVVQASWLNAQVRDNGNYLMNGRPLQQTGGDVSAYSTTNSAYVAVSTARMGVTINPTGTKVQVQAGVAAVVDNSSNNYGDWTLTISGAGLFYNSDAFVRVAQNRAQHFQLEWTFTGCQTGSAYLCYVRYKNSADGTGTIYVNQAGQHFGSWIEAREVS